MLEIMTVAAAVRVDTSTALQVKQQAVAVVPHQLFPLLAVLLTQLRLVRAVQVHPEVKLVVSLVVIRQ